jgi:hypothetical protein
MNVSFILGNTLTHQSDYEERVATILLSDLEEKIPKFSINPQKIKIAIAGNLGYSALTNLAFAKYPIVNKIVQLYLRQGWGHSYHKLRSLGFPIYPNLQGDVISRGKNFSPISAPIVSRSIYDIYIEKIILL